MPTRFLSLLLGKQKMKTFERRTSHRTRIIFMCFMFTLVQHDQRKKRDVPFHRHISSSIFFLRVIIEVVLGNSSMLMIMLYACA